MRATVKSEVRQQSFDRPYGRFVWIDVPELAQTRWENSHSIYGETADGKMESLDAATLDDANTFFRTYYTPRNASLAIYGDVDPAEAITLVRKYFAAIPAGAPPPSRDTREPPQQAEKRFVRVDSNAARPALAIAYHLPPRSSPDFWVMGILDQILVEGRDSWMHASLVQRRGLTEAVYGGLSPRHGTMYTINGPNFWAAYAFHDASQSPDTLLAGMDAEIERVRSGPVSGETLQRAINKARADFYAEWNAGFGEGRVDMLGQLALFDGDPGRINRLDKQFQDITADVVLRVAREYLAPRNRVVLQLRTKGNK